MNKKFKRLSSLILAIAIAAAIPASVVSMTACKNGGPSQQQQKMLSRIGVTTKPDKIVYTVGESFDPAGMVVTAYYNDQSNEAVAIDDCQILVDDPLEVTTRSAMIMYKGKTAILPITVNMELEEKLHIESDGHEVYTVEAEDLDYQYCYNPYGNDGKVSIENVVTASGGKSAGSLAGEGNSFGFIVNSDHDLTVDLVIRAAAVHEDRPCDTVMDVNVNGTTHRSGHVLEWGENGSYYNWENVTYKDVQLNKGENRIEVLINVQWYAPNIDCFYIVVAPDGEENLEPPAKYDVALEINSDENKVYTVEAEDLDLKEWEGAEVKDSTSASEGKYVDLPNTVDNYSSGHSHNMGFTVKSDVAGTVEIAMSLRYRNDNSGDGLLLWLDSILKIYWNGTQVTTNYEFKTNNDSTWELVKVTGELDLKAGNNVLEMQTKEFWTPNIDCFYIVVDPQGNEEYGPAPIVPDKPLYKTLLEVTDGESKVYTVQAEEMELDGWEGAKVEGNVVAGLSGDWNFNNSHALGFNVSSTVTAKVKIAATFICENIEESGKLDEILNIKWKGETLTSNYTFKSTDGTPETVTFETELDLAVGNNYFTLQGNYKYWVPKIDCFYITVNPTGEEEIGPKADINSAENKVYTFEAEDADLSGWNGAKVEDNADASGGKSIGGLSGEGNFNGSNKLTFTVNSAVEGKVKISLVVAYGNNPEGQKLDDLVALKWNGTDVNTAFAFSAQSGWTTWDTAVITMELDLIHGTNTFTIQAKGYWAINVDCIKLEVNPQA